ncbi:MAG TPA: BrnT family toxin [Thermodesulfobacteriota bacterium]|nr:BrnT family toxin [Thermodesulfobacteriota bacterium]
MQYNFEWDPYKAKQNLRKHKVSFERAAEVFLDPLAISIYDEQHSSDENRWITIGKEQTNLVLVVIHTFDEKNLDNCKIRFDLRQKGNKEGDQTIPG